MPSDWNVPLPSSPLQVPSDWNGFTYVYEGSGSISGTKASIEQVRLGEAAFYRVLLDDLL